MRRTLSIFLLLAASSACLTKAQDRPPQEPVQKVGPGVQAPIALATSEADMPSLARQKRQGGMCLISMIVDAKGDPVNPRIVRCTDPMFAKNSIDAVLRFRFKPAVRVSDGSPVPVMITVEINFRLDGRPVPPLGETRYGFLSPPGMSSVGPDADGVYPLSKELELPVMKEFVSKGFNNAAESFWSEVGCHVLLTLSAKGKPQDAQVLDCDKPILKEPAADSLMKSKYKPAKLNGKAVPVRMIVELVYEGIGLHTKSNEGPSTNSSHP